MMQFAKVENLFESLNKLTNYVILRNFEDFPKSLTDETHPDIDVLCDSAELIINAFNLMNREGYNDKIHFFVEIDNRKVDLDIREIGDGYYDEKWEKHILQCRVLKNNLFYVPSLEDYFYSLLYHVKIQKYYITKDYYNKLETMAQQLGITRSLAGHQVLEDFMRSNGYRYTYPSYKRGTFNIKGIDKNLLEDNCEKMISRLIYRIFLKFGVTLHG